MSFVPKREVRQVSSIELGASTLRVDSRFEHTPVRSIHQENSVHLSNRESPVRPSSPSKRSVVSQYKDLSQSHYRSTIYYSQAGQKYPEAPTVFFNENHPGQMHRKTLEQLEYENHALLMQLHERDEVLAMYKSGWSPDRLPINEEIIRSLNLHISHKNMLLEQIKRSIAHFHEVIHTQHIEISAICSEQFLKIQALIRDQENYPIFITQRLIDTSHTAERIYLQQSNHTMSSQFVLIKEKLEKYESMHVEITRELDRFKFLYVEVQEKFAQAQAQWARERQEIDARKLPELANLKDEIYNLKQELYYSKQERSERNRLLSLYFEEIQNYYSSLHQQIRVGIIHGASHANGYTRDFQAILDERYRRISESYAKYHSNQFKDEFLWHQEWLELHRKWEALLVQVNDHRRVGSGSAEDQHRIAELGEELARNHITIATLRDEVEYFKSVVSTKEQEIYRKNHTIE